MVSFADTKGIFAETAISQLATLGVFGNVSGDFHPRDPLTRATYVRWLVTANNIYFASNPRKQIRLAEGSDAVFVDVPPSNPDYKYIQGMADAGYVIGHDKTHFLPNHNITREEMLTILVHRDENGGSGDTTAAGQPPNDQYGDAAQISKVYRQAIHDDGWDMSMNSRFNGTRIFGSAKTLHPQRPVTRGEAAVSLQEIDGVKAASVLPAQPTK